VAEEEAAQGPGSSKAIQDLGFTGLRISNPLSPLQIAKFNLKGCVCRLPDEEGTTKDYKRVENRG
jgi:hypothetical protein